jgi:hypothetical protein
MGAAYMHTGFPADVSSETLNNMSGATALEQ